MEQTQFFLIITMTTLFVLAIGTASVISIIGVGVAVVAQALIGVPTCHKQ